MQKLFWGIILVFLNFNLDLGNVRIGLIPNFIGYYLLAKGLAELADKSMRFQKCIPYAKGATIYAAILYAMDLFAVTNSLGGFIYVLSIASMALALYISYQIIMGIKDIETQCGLALGGDSLKTTWIVLAVLNVLVYPAQGNYSLNFLISIGATVVAILFIVQFYQLTKRYSTLPTE